MWCVIDRGVFVVRDVEEIGDVRVRGKKRMGKRGMRI